MLVGAADPGSEQDAKKDVSADKGQGLDLEADSQDKSCLQTSNSGRMHQPMDSAYAAAVEPEDQAGMLPGFAGGSHGWHEDITSRALQAVTSLADGAWPGSLVRQLKECAQNGDAAADLEQDGGDGAAAGVCAGENAAQPARADMTVAVDKSWARSVLSCIGMRQVAVDVWLAHAGNPCACIAMCYACLAANAVAVAMCYIAGVHHTFLHVAAISKLASSVIFAIKLWVWGPQLHSHSALRFAMAHIAFDTVCQLVMSVPVMFYPVELMPFQSRPLTLSLAYTKDWPALVVHLMAGQSPEMRRAVPHLLPLLWTATTRMFKAFDVSGDIMHMRLMWSQVRPHTSAKSSRASLRHLLGLLIVGHELTKLRG
jgi:hypothetical protein